MAQSKWSTPGPSGRDSNTEFGPSSPPPGAPPTGGASVDDPTAQVNAANAAFGTNAAGPGNAGWMIGKSEAPSTGGDADESAGDSGT